MSARRSMLAALVSLCALVSCLTLGSATSQATVTHQYLSQISEIPATGPHGEAVASHGRLQAVQGLTVDAGHLWTVERRERAGRVDEFSATSHEFEFQLDWPASLEIGETGGPAIGHATSETELYVPFEEKANPVVGVFDASGNLQARWTGADAPVTFNSVIYSLAVDNSHSLSDWAAGDVYVSTVSRNEEGSGVVDIFKPESGGKEKYVGQLPGPEPGGDFPGAYRRYLAVDESNGDVLVAEGELTPEAVVYVFEPSAVVGQYTLVHKLTGAGSPTGPFQLIKGVATDPEGHIYVIDDIGGAEVVDQFSSEGVYLGHITGTPSGFFPALALPSVAVDPASNDVYIGTTAGVVDIFGPGVVVPDVTTGPVSNVKARSAALNGTVNPDEAGTATCSFAWGTSTSFGKVAPCEPEGVASGGNPVPVHVALSGLAPDTTYHYRLQASNASGSNPGEASQDQEFSTPGPGIQEESASIVTSVSATLGAKIDPDEAATSYYFQYGTSAAYGTSLPAQPGLGLGAAKGYQAVNVHLQGLATGTTYHYRVVAVSESGGEPIINEGPDETFTTQATGAALTLPDGRQWEMVSPPNKQGSGIFALGYEQGDDIQAAADGGGITYGADSPFAVNPAGSRSLEVTQVLSNRLAPGSWETNDITTEHDEEKPAGPAIGEAAEYKLFSTDLSLGLVEPAGNSPLPPLPAGSEKTIYLREADGSYKALVTSANVPTGTKFSGPTAISGSPDLSHVVMRSDVALVSGAPATGGLYEWAEGQLQLVSVLPNGQGEPDATLGEHGDEISGVVRHAISDDGSRVVWTAGDGNKYLRDMARKETVEIDAAQEGLPETGGGAPYATASSDDSRVFFTSGEHLTANSTLNSREDLYVFEVTSGASEPLAGRVTDLSPAHAGEGAGVQGVIGASEDGSYVYFVAGALLGDAAEHGAEGGHYLYMEHYDVATKTWSAPRFIAALSAEDSPTWGSGNRENLDEMTSRVSPDGRYLAFMSQRSLTGYENRDANSDALDEEVFLYDANSEKVVCASCDPTGGRPVGLEVGGLFDERLISYTRELWENRWLAANVPGWTTTASGRSLYQSRYLSDSGRLFFNSVDALVPADVNGKADVYEYEPNGVGSCQGAGQGQSASVVFSEAVGGCIALISAGTSSEESAFMDASESGGDVFFLTLSRLSLSDSDTSIDMYDAHECTASGPCAPPVALAPPPCTTGDACKAAPTPQPALFGAPSSETFSGAGNVVPSTSGSTVKSESKAKTKTPSRAQKLAKALKACRKKPKHKQAECERTARDRYGAKGSRVGKSLSARARR